MNDSDLGLRLMAPPREEVGKALEIFPAFSREGREEAMCHVIKICHDRDTQFSDRICRFTNSMHTVIHTHTMLVLYGR